MFAKSLKLKDIKDKTVTGAMPFAGGPLNSYVLHSTAKIIEKHVFARKAFPATFFTGFSEAVSKPTFARLAPKEPSRLHIYVIF